jgi:NAD(P)-dependent dehydrogenase (short-subunit alcohol dehydrogenase family)
MMRRGAGSIVNIGSVQRVVAPAFGNYAGNLDVHAADYYFRKHGFDRSHPVRCGAKRPERRSRQCALPGRVRNPGHAGELLERYCRRVFLGRLAPMPTSKVLWSFLASGGSAYITGHNLTVDGGYTASIQ